MELLIFPKKVPWIIFEVPWNFKELDKFDILKNHISKYCSGYLIDDYMLIG